MSSRDDFTKDYLVPSASAVRAQAAALSQANMTRFQKALKKLGYDPGNLDGTVAPLTQAAIKNFQKDNGLAADGILTPKTQAALAKALQGGVAVAGSTPVASTAAASSQVSATPHSRTVAPAWQAPMMNAAPAPLKARTSMPDWTRITFTPVTVSAITLAVLALLVDVGLIPWLR